LEGNRKFILSLVGVGILIGIIISLIFSGIVHVIKKVKQDTPVKANAESSQGVSSETEVATDGEDGTSSIEETTIKNNEVPTSAGDSWKSDTVYNGGEKVQFKGKIYEASWWTQGNEPGTETGTDASPWKFIENAKVASENPAKKEEDKKLDNITNTPLKNTKDTGFKVVGYYPDWEPEKHDRIQFDVVTHINYAFAIPKIDGTIMPLDNPNNAKKLIQSAHKNNVKVLIAVGGWSYKEIPLENTFIEATNSDAKIKTLTASIMKMVKEYGFDGVDMDWEHPRPESASQKQYENLMLALKTELKKEGLLLTSAVLSGVSAEGTVMWDAAAHTDAVINCVDWFNVMAYDGGDGDRHSSYDFAVNCGNYWKNTRKMPKEKVVLGLPFYGRPSWASYDEILKANPNADKTDISMINGLEAHYNGVATITKKTKWAKENVGGVMIWELSQDTLDKNKSLLSTIQKTIK